ncbi:MAG: hypothetical protein RQ952_05265 [Thermoproteota archaeon]|jgi:hypothetical protein|nr:hypothetical protein [Thermoproteota archaeon]
MPKEIKNKEEFIKLLPLAVECRVKQNKDHVKIKLRTKRMLYTYKTTNQDEVKEILDQVKCPIINIT